MQPGHVHKTRRCRRSRRRLAAQYAGVFHFVGASRHLNGSGGSADTRETTRRALVCTNDDCAARREHGGHAVFARDRVGALNTARVAAAILLSRARPLDLCAAQPRPLMRSVVRDALGRRALAEQDAAKAPAAPAPASVVAGAASGGAVAALLLPAAPLPPALAATAADLTSRASSSSSASSWSRASPATQRSRRLAASHVAARADACGAVDAGDSCISSVPRAAAGPTTAPTWTAVVADIV
jgi:hypothetical protein